MKKPILLPILLTLLAAAGAAGIVTSGALWWLDARLYDTAVQYWPARADPSLVLVTIDEPSLAKLGPWIWPRSRHAELLDKLHAAGSGPVFLDLILSEPSQDPTQDARLAAAMRRHGQVVLSVIASGGGEQQPPVELLPVPILAQAAAGLAHTDIPTDQDGISRGIFLRAGLGDPHWPALGAALAGATAACQGLERPAHMAGASPYQWQRNCYIGTRFTGAGNAILRLSYADVLTGQVPAELLRGKRILVGVTATGVATPLRTPMSYTRGMSAVEYQANVANTLMKQTAIVPLQQQQDIALSSLLTLAVCALLALRSGYPEQMLAIALAGLLASLGLSTALVYGWHHWWSPAAMCTALALATLGWMLLHASRW